ncbi:DUF3392 family protein [Salinibius halmophilus]|uniref:DUF3392 family protein n=1 Tax=Salinibius halmophilus TaxID=1853216 RepID=UPI000E67241D|nr:DUF3392 family protein [Salinibius halmophilus]
MDLIQDFLYQLTGWLRPHLTTIVYAAIASLLVIFGNRINRAVFSFVKDAHFLLRTLVFILLCAVGYGLLLIFFADLLRQGLLMIPSLWLGLVIVLGFLVIGWLAEKNSR